MRKEDFLYAMEKVDVSIINNSQRERVIHDSINSNLGDGNPRGHRNLIITIEELSELQKEVSKELRSKGDRIAILEEMADVNVCMMYLKELLNISDDDIERAVQVKIERLEEVLKKKGVYE